MRPIIITVAVLGIAVFGISRIIANDPKIPIQQEAYFDELCRGTINDAACTRRQELIYELSGLDWCYGKGEQAAYQRQWHKCYVQRSLPTRINVSRRV
jgi:hypothetical protein